MVREAALLQARAKEKAKENVQVVKMMTRMGVPQTEAGGCLR
jgi:hypothetical protein